MSLSFWELFKTNLRVIYRDTGGIFWTIAVPVFIYVAVSILPLDKIVNTQFKYSSYVLPGIIAMVVMQGGIYSLAYWMVDLRGRGILKRFMVTPINKVELILSMLAARVLVMYLQVAALTLVGLLFFHAVFYWNIFSILLLVLLGGSVFLIVGLLISTFADSYQAAAPITTAIGLPLAILSSIFYPLEQLPHALAVIARVLPITYLADGLRSVYLQPFDFSLISRNLLVLALWLVAGLFIAIWRFKLEE